MNNLSGEEKFVNHWLYPANTKFYDVIGAFSNDETYWPRNSNVQAGDTLFIYLAVPYKQIAFKCEVIRADLTGDKILKEVSTYFKQEPKDPDPLKAFLKVKTLSRYELDPKGSLTLSYLKDHGLKGMLMGPRKLENAPDLMRYIMDQTGGL
ncbi:MAG: hypothetical protein MI743_02390 [Sneathiellales bacterium]|nr:hypothetical protein [Sneathiellales bacterium]